MAIKFNEATHEYYLNNKKLISVTQLMRKHHLSPNYRSVDEDVLKAKAERGTFIHKEIENYNKNREVGFTNECINYIDYIVKNKIDVIFSECIVYNDLVAGTIDLVLCKDGTYCIADIKTTSSLHRESVSWQLSIYAYLFNEMHKDTIVKTDIGQAYHFNKDGELRVVDIPLKPKEEVERLFQCERDGVIYEKSTDNTFDLSELAEIEQEIKDLQEREKAIKEELLSKMETKQITNLEDNTIKITYVAPIVKTTIDNARLKKEHPDIIEMFSKTTTTKSSLRVTLKGETK